MKSFVSKHYVFALLSIIALFFFEACNKSDVLPNDESLSENSELIDEVSQQDEITPIELNLTVVDGIAVFENHQKFINALDILEKQNIESLASWEEKQGFTSLFSELMRIEELPISEIEKELNRGRLQSLIKVDEEHGVLDLIHHNLLISRILNTDGLVGIGDFVGTIEHHLNIWTEFTNVSELRTGLNDRNFDNPNFIIFLDKTEEAESRSWTSNFSDCPQDDFWTTNWIFRKNPGVNRRMYTKATFDVLKTPAGGGLFDYTVKMVNSSRSYKGPFNKYKTDHYHSHNFDWTTFSPNTGTTNETDFDQGNNKKVHTSSVTIASVTNVSNSWTINNGRRLIRTHPGSSWGQGQAMSHRGMGGRFERIDCD